MWRRQLSPSPALFLTSGGMSKECKQFVNRLADLIVRKSNERYCDVVRHVRTRISLPMLRTTYRSSWVQKKEDRHQT